jgi:hypothetical protein
MLLRPLFPKAPVHITHLNLRLYQPDRFPSLLAAHGVNA